MQHLVTVALGGGFQADALFDEVRRAWNYRDLPREAFQWALDFMVQGGPSLGAYPEYHRVAWVDGAWRVPDRSIAQRHRLQVGTIVGESSMLVKWWSKAGSGGGTLGQVEESFIARLKPGDCFVFGGRVLEYERTQDMAAYVRKAVGKRGIVPAWAGGKMPLSSELAEATRAVLAGVALGDEAANPDEPELQAGEPVDLASLLDQSVFDAGPGLPADMLASLNSSELARQRFREIARVAGLVFTGYPGAPKSSKQLQASSSLFYDVFRQYDPANRLLGQADAEVLAQELDLQQLAACPARLRWP